MNKESTATEANATAIAPQEVTKTAVTTQDDLEAKFLASEAEKKRLEEERNNYKNAYLKEKRKKGEDFVDEDEDDKIRRITEETIANSRLAQIAQEQDEIIKKALKENKELKLAQMNRNSTPPTALGSHSEGQTVTDTSITPEQLAFFKSKGWNDKDIENYKKNARKNGAIR